MEGRQVVTEVNAEGCPSAPEAASTKFVNQCGVTVRARILITTRLWKMSKSEEQQHVVPAHQKEMLWVELKDMFTLSEVVDQELVKKCAGAKGHEYSYSSCTRKGKEKDSIPPSGWTLKEEAENG